MKKLKMYTDASFKEGVSTHHYRLITPRGYVKKRRTLKSNEQDSIRAELHSIAEGIRYLNQRDIKNVVIYTDSVAAVKIINNSEDKRMGADYLRLVMKQLDIEVRWVSRATKQIAMADYYCGQLLETVMNRKEYQQVSI